MQDANHYEVTNDFSLSFSACVEAQKAFSDKYVFVKGKIVLLQAIVPSCLSFDVTTPFLSKFQPQLLQIRQCFRMYEFAEF